MQHLKPHPVKSFENLRGRIDRLFDSKQRKTKSSPQLSLDFPFEYKTKKLIEYPSKKLSSFLDFISAAVPDGNVYLFGGLIRDIALYGKKGFHSDIDVVVEGNWEQCIGYLEQLGAERNKFGGYRLVIANWPVDIWNARETWAIKHGFVTYDGISSLTKTTVLNWDAILMNWRTRNFVSTENYLSQLERRVIDIVLEDNPDPMGMVVRVLRHLCSKDARKVTANTVIFLATKTNQYSFAELKARELSSYGNTMINPDVYKFFHELKGIESNEIESKMSIASDIVKRELGLTN
jgi:predicted nucleotidyltransferase